MTHHGVIFQPIHCHILAVPGEFLPAVGHFADQHKVGIYPSATILQAGAEAIGAAHVKTDDTCPKRIPALFGEA